MADEFKFIDSRQADVASLIRVRSMMSGFSGSGKTYTALKLATELGKLLEPVYGRRPTTWVLDTERESALLYRGEFDFQHMPFNPPHKTSRYFEAFAVLRRHAKPGDIFLYDSMSHAWAGAGGILERVDIEAKRFAGNKWAAWAILTPEQQRLVDELLGLPMHLFATTRARVEWVEGESHGKKTYEKKGTQSVQREGLEYEFTVELVFNEKGGRGVEVGKTRIKALEGEVFNQPGTALAKLLFAFAMTGKGDSTDEEVEAGAKRYKDAAGVTTKTIAESSPAIVEPERKAEPGRVSAVALAAAAMAKAAEQGKAAAATEKPAGAAATATAGATGSPAETAPAAASAAATSTSGEAAKAGEPPQPAAAAQTPTEPTSSARAVDALAARMRAAKTPEELLAVRGDVAKCATDGVSLTIEELMKLSLVEVEAHKALTAAQASAKLKLEADATAAATMPLALAEVGLTEQQRLAAEPSELNPQVAMHRCLAEDLSRIDVDDDETFRKFPGRISEAAKKKLLDGVGYDDLKEAYTTLKKARDKRRAATKKGTTDAR